MYLESRGLHNGRVSGRFEFRKATFLLSIKRDLRRMCYCTPTGLNTRIKQLCFGYHTKILHCQIFDIFLGRRKTKTRRCCKMCSVKFCDIQWIGSEFITTEIIC